MAEILDIESFTWDNLQADVYLGQHAEAVRLYMERVAIPALNAIEARRQELLLSPYPGAVFEQSDIDILRRSTIEAFILSVQSLWEKQLRTFLSACARELRHSDSYVRSLETSDWPGLAKRFRELRGLDMVAFDSFLDLDRLQLLGNACRHGNGKSARRLYECWPELWPHIPATFPAAVPLAPHATAEQSSEPAFSEAVLSHAVLDRMSRAVIWFWDDHSYIYTNSIKRKHYSVETTLARMRAARALRDHACSRS